LRYGIDSELSGAFVVDPVGASSNDEIFVMEMMSEHPGANASQRAFTSASRHDERPRLAAARSMILSSIS
jgi:hypothetical protein